MIACAATTFRPRRVQADSVGFKVKSGYAKSLQTLIASNRYPDIRSGIQFAGSKLASRD
jgi:hypothetical protein